MLKFNLNGKENYHNVIIISLGATGLHKRSDICLWRKLHLPQTVTPILPRPLYQEWHDEEEELNSDDHHPYPFKSFIDDVNQNKVL